MDPSRPGETSQVFGVKNQNLKYLFSFIEEKMIPQYAEPTAKCGGSAMGCSSDMTFAYFT